jgi:hypothetical protein
MRKLEKLMVQMVQGKNTGHCGSNTVVKYDNVLNTSCVRLHSNHIATYDHTNAILLVNRETLAKYPTNTTKSRLRALGANVKTKQGKTYLDGILV